MKTDSLFMLNLPIDSTSIKTLAGLVSGQTSPAAVPESNWTELIPLALDHGLGGMLLWSLRQAGWACTEEPRWQPLIDATRRHGQHNLRLEKMRRQVAAALDLAEVPAIWLKGIALAHTHYPEPHLRPMVDLDVLVPLDRVTAAREALLSRGFQLEEADFFVLGGFTEHARHHESLVERTGQVRLELHFRLLVPPLHKRFDDECLDWFWTQTEQLTPGGPSFRALKPEANLLHLCAHAILQHQGEPLDLLHLLDLHLLLEKSPLDWDLVVEQAAVMRWTYAVELALGLLPGLFGTPLPAGLMDTLQERRPVDERPLFMLDKQQSIMRWEEWSSAFEHMPARQRLRLVWLTLFPPDMFMRQQYHLTAGQTLLPYYVVHFLQGGREVVRVLLQGASRPEQPSNQG